MPSARHKQVEGDGDKTSTLLDKTSDGGTAACTAERPKVAATQAGEKIDLCDIRTEGHREVPARLCEVVACALSILPVLNR